MLIRTRSGTEAVDYPEYHEAGYSGHTAQRNDQDTTYCSPQHDQTDDAYIFNQDPRGKTANDTGGVYDNKLLEESAWALSNKI